MTDVRIQALIDALGAPIASGGVLTAQVFEGRKPAVRISGEDATFPVVVRLDLTGAAEESFAIYELPPTMYWRIFVTVGSYTVSRNVVLPAGAGPFDFADLVDVDPVTVLPDAGTALADAFIAELEAIRDAAAASASSAADSAASAASAVADALVDYSTTAELEAGADATVAAQVESGPLTGAALDVATAGLVGDSGSDTAAALNAAYAPQLTVYASRHGFSASATGEVNSAALATAIAAAAAAGSVLEIGPGVFHLESTVEVGESILIRGHGALSTLHMDNLATPAIKVTAEDVSIEDLTFTGEGLDATGLPLYGAGSFRGHVGIWVDGVAHGFTGRRLVGADLSMLVSLGDPAPYSPAVEYPTPIERVFLEDLKVSGVWAAIEGHAVLDHPIIRNVRGSYARFTGTPSSGDVASPAHLVYLGGDGTNTTISPEVQNVVGYGTTEISTPLKIKRSTDVLVRDVRGVGTFGIMEVEAITRGDFYGLSSSDDVSTQSYNGSSIWVVDSTDVTIHEPHIVFANGAHGHAIRDNSGSARTRVIRPTVVANLSTAQSSLAAIELRSPGAEVASPTIRSVGAILGYGVILNSSYGQVTDPQGFGALTCVASAEGGRQIIAYDSLMSLPPLGGTNSVVGRITNAAAAAGACIRDRAVGQTVPVGFTDSFNRDNSASLGHTDDRKPYSRVGVSGPFNGSWGIVSNASKYSGGDARGLALVDGGAADGDLTVVVKALGTGTDGVVVRSIDSQNYIALAITTGTLTLTKRVSGSASTLGTYSGTINVGDTIAVVLSGTSVSVLLNAVEVIAPVAVSDFSTVTTHGLVGVTGSTFSADSLTFA